MPVTVEYAKSRLSYGQKAPDIRGAIKSRIEDFVVVEELAALEGQGEHAYLLIRKSNANTHWVAMAVAEYAGIPYGDVGYAGRKDRYAITDQWFSCYLPGQDRDWTNMQIEGVTLLKQTRHRSKLRLGDLVDNRFEIMVRLDETSDDLPNKLQGDNASQSLLERLEFIRESGFPNYYGPQRFGHAGENLNKADELLRVGRKLKHNRDLYLSAARSWLFNLYLSQRIADADGAWRQETGPLYGKSRDPQPGELALDEMGQAWIAGLRRLGIKVGERALCIVPRELNWSLTGSALQLRFSLPSGVFATSLLRELFIINDASDRWENPTDRVTNG